MPITLVTNLNPTSKHVAEFSWMLMCAHTSRTVRQPSMESGYMALHGMCEGSAGVCVSEGVLMCVSECWCV